MKILMVASEAAPFAKTGGLADAVSALSKTLSEMGHDVKVVIPRYYGIDRTKLSPFKKSVLVNTGWEDVSVDYYNDEITYFVDYEPLFGRDGVYVDKDGRDFPDNALRFSVFARAALEFCKITDWTPDIVHCHDWAACIVPVLIKYTEKRNFPNTKTVLSIHNLGYQGIFQAGDYNELGLSEKIRFPSGLAHYDCINFLKAGIVSSDIISTVSETYAKEIQTAEQGFGLDGILRMKSGNLQGIVNGADLTEWNPETDRYIPAQYSLKNMKGKAECKKALQKEFGLEQNPDIPLIGLVGRLASQKGIRELFAPGSGCMYKMCTELKVQVVLVGSGEAWCQEEIKNLSANLPNFKAFIGYSEKMSHLVESGSDFFLMPSQYEPCGLNQIYSMLYGTLPIVRKTGGLADTVLNYSEDPEKATGFTFEDLTPEAIFNTVKWAVELFADKKAIQKMQQNGMKKDFSWPESAKKYVELYK